MKTESRERCVQNFFKRREGNGRQGRLNPWCQVRIVLDIKNKENQHSEEWYLSGPTSKKGQVNNFNPYRNMTNDFWGEDLPTFPFISLNPNLDPDLGGGHHNFEKQMALRSKPPVSVVLQIVINSSSYPCPSPSRIAHHSTEQLWTQNCEVWVSFTTEGRGH